MACLVTTHDRLKSHQLRVKPVLKLAIIRLAIKGLALVYSIFSDINIDAVGQLLLTSFVVLFRSISSFTT